LMRNELREKRTDVQQEFLANGKYVAVCDC
jgi:hypothetical protein